MLTQTETPTHKSQIESRIRSLVQCSMNYTHFPPLENENRMVFTLLPTQKVLNSKAPSN